MGLQADPAIVMPRADIVGMTSDSIPYLKPAAIFLFKAKYRRAKDEVGVTNALPKLQQSERAWLKQCLGICHPGHEWAGML